MDMAKPIIRFKGYQDDWEQRKLGDLVIDHNAGIYISKEDYGEGTNVIGVGNIYDRDIFDGEIYRLGPVNDDKFILDENDILYGESSLVPEGIARTVCVGKNGAGSAFAWHTRRVKLDKNIVNSHVATLELNYLHDIRKYLVSVSTQTALTGMTTEGYFGVTLTLPSVEEQQKISDYFKNLDHFITLHQRKCDETKRLKKYMLQKMFPQNGEKVPEIRFSGFTDDWEQRKVCNITTSYSGGTPKSGYTEYYDGDIPFIRSGEIYSDKTELFITELGMKNSSAKMVHEGDILYALYGATSGEVSRAKLDGAINQAILAIVPNDDINANFLVEWFRKEKDKITDTYLQGGQGNLSAQIIKELEVTIPSYDEQNKIGLYFEQLNTLITLHQRELENLQNIKKFMLGKMFV